MWLSGFNKRIKLTADHTKIDSDLSHFPLTIFLKSGNGDTEKVFDEVGSNKYKIAVTKSDGTTQLYVEIEQWDSTNKVGVLHAGLNGDTLSSSSDTIYYLYYDANASDNTSYVGDVGSRTEVWDSNFKGVWHFNGNVLDSTSNGNNGTDQGTSDVAGKIANARDFEESESDRVELGDILDVGSNDFTLEAWVKLETLPSTLSANESIFCKYWGVDGQRSYWFRFDVNDVLSIITSPDGTNTSTVNGSTNPSVNVWYYVAVVKSGTTATLYFNGVSDGSGTVDETLYDVSNFLVIGASKKTDGTIGSEFDGVIDEPRFSMTARSSAWIKATYYSTSDSLLTYGSEEILKEGNAIFFGTNF